MRAEKLFSFATWATDHPGEPVPGDRLDIQLDNHKRAIDSLSSALSQLLRADGKLNHDLITPESLPDGITHNLVHKTQAAVEGFALPALARAREAQSALEARQLQLLSELDEARALLHEARSINAKTKSLSTAAESKIQASSAQVTEALQASAKAFEDFNWDLFQANTAEDWASVAIAWAEYMDANATIPPNILATNGITGDHWSSRWWANRSASAFGMLAWWYQGAWPGMPPYTPLTPTGQPIPVGAMFFNTTTNTMMVWNGSTWISSSSPQKGVTASLYYAATAGQTVFPLGAVDRHGNTFAFSTTTPEGVEVYIDGAGRLEPQYDYSVTYPSSTVTLVAPALAGAIVTIDVMVPALALTPSGSANTLLVGAITPDGTTTVFTGLSIAATGALVSASKSEELAVSVDGVLQQPGASYSASGSTITFAEPPVAGANVFIVWFGPPVLAGSGGGGGGIPEAPNDGQYYARHNLAWAVGPGGLADAVSDGTLYGRKGGSWQHATHADLTDWAASLAPYALLANPVFTGNPQAPTPRRETTTPASPPRLS